MAGLHLYLDGVGTILHHSGTSLIICGLATHLFPLSRQMTAACILPVVQHVFMLVKYSSFTTFCAIQLLLEVVFEWEILANVGQFETQHGYDITRFGRGCALVMLLSHWFYLSAAAANIAPQVLRAFKRRAQDEASPATCAEASESEMSGQLSSPSALTAARRFVSRASSGSGDLRPSQGRSSNRSVATGTRPSSLPPLTVQIEEPSASSNAVLAPYGESSGMRARARGGADDGGAYNEAAEASHASVLRV